MLSAVHRIIYIIYIRTITLYLFVKENNANNCIYIHQPGIYCRKDIANKFKTNPVFIYKKIIRVGISKILHIIITHIFYTDKKKIQDENQAHN